MTAVVVLIDAVSSGLLGIASHLSHNASLGNQVGTAVTYLHVLVLVGESLLPSETIDIMNTHRS